VVRGSFTSCVYRLAIDLVDLVAGFVLDPGVVTDGQQLLAHLIALGSGLVVVVPEKSHGVHPSLIAGQPGLDTSAGNRPGH
jgi:hypothetical protein